MTDNTNTATETTEQPVPARDLNATETTRLSELRTEFANVEADGQSYHTRRALMFRNQFKYVAEVGQLVLANYVEQTLKFNVSGFRKAGFNVCALAITGINVLAETDKNKRAELHNRVQPVTQALDALNHFRADHEALSDEKFVDWWNQKGRLSGLHAKFKAATKEPKGEPMQDEHAVDAAVESIVANGAAIEVSSLPGLGTGTVSLYVAQGQGDKARMVRLDVTPEFIASLADKAPDPMNDAPKRLLFFRQLLMAGASIVPDQVSDVPKTPLKPGEKASETTVMLPANAITLVRDGVFSIALSRKADTVVLEVEPGEDLSKWFSGERFIDTRTRNTMLPRLTESRLAAGYIGEDKVSISDTGRIRFEHKDKKLSGQLLSKPLSDMGSLYTHRVHGFKAVAECEMDKKEQEAFVTRFLAGVVKKRDDHPITVAVKDGAITFQHGKAKPVSIASTTVTGEASVRVKQGDFKRVMTGLLDLPLSQGIAFYLDPMGMLRIDAMTDAADFRAYIQTLREGEAEGAQVPERARLKRVERPEEQAELLAA